MSDIEKLRRRLAEISLLAELRPHLHTEFAVVAAEKHAERIARTPDDEPDPASVQAVAREVVAAADARWRLDAPGGDTFFDNLRATLRARQAERDRQQREVSEALDRLAGGR